jgi:hypothetical protein
MKKKKKEVLHSNRRRGVKRTERERPSLTVENDSIMMAQDKLGLPLVLFVESSRVLISLAHLYQTRVFAIQNISSRETKPPLHFHSLHFTPLNSTPLPHYLFLSLSLSLRVCDVIISDDRVSLLLRSSAAARAFRSLIHHYHLLLLLLLLFAYMIIIMITFHSSCVTPR